MSMKEEGNNREFIGIIDNAVYDLGNSIQDYNQKFKTIGHCISIPVRNLFIWCENVLCSIFSSPYITDALVCFIYFLHVEPLWNIISKSEIQSI